MADPFDAALEEAYASAPAKVVILRTLEFWHPSFDVPARVVRDHGTLLSEDPEVFGHELTLEIAAPRDAGESVVFVAAAFGATPPGSEENVIPQMTLTVDGVPGDLAEALKNSTAEPGEVEVIYREYFASDPTGPLYVLDGLTLSRTNATMVKVTGKAGFEDPTAKSFPGTTYNSNDYPSLAR